MDYVILFHSRTFYYPKLSTIFHCHRCNYVFSRVVRVLCNFARLTIGNVENTKMSWPAQVSLHRNVLLNPPSPWKKRKKKRKKNPPWNTRSKILQRCTCCVSCRIVERHVDRGNVATIYLSQTFIHIFNRRHRCFILWPLSPFLSLSLSLFLPKPRFHGPIPIDYS